MAVKKKINPSFNTEPVASVVAPIQGRPVPAPIVKKPKPITSPAPIQGRPVEQGTPKTSKHSVKVAPIQTMAMASAEPVYDFSNVPPPNTIGHRYWRNNVSAEMKAAYDAQASQPVAEEVVSLDSAFDTAEDPFAIEQPTPTDPNSLSEYGTEQRPYIAPIDWSTIDPSTLPDLSNIGDLGNLDQDAMFNESQRQRTEQIDDIGLSRDYFTDEQFTDDQAFFDLYIPKLEEFKQGQRDALTDLFATDSEQFGTVFEQLDPNSQLNFLEGQYSAGDLDRDKYLGLAQQVLYSEQSRLYPDQEPLNHYYIQGDKLYEVSSTFANDVSADRHSREVILFDDQELINNDLRRDETQLFRDAIGSTNYVNADTDSKWVKIRDHVITPLATITASIATGGMSSAVETAIRGISGETLHAGDWATLGVAGLEAAGVIKPPVDGSSVAGPAGIGPTLPTTGVGIGSLTYNQSVALINGAATGDVETLAVGMLGEAVIDKAFTGVKDGDKLLGVFQADDAKAALQDVVANVAQGAELDDAALSGLLTYAEEGGGFSPDLGSDVDLGIIEDVVKALVEPVQAVASAVGAVIEDVAQVAGDVIEDVAQPVGDVIEDVAQVAGDVVEDVGQVVGDFGSTIDDEIIQPYVRPALQEFDDAVLQPAGDVVEDVAQVTGDVVEDVGQAVGDVAEDLAQAIAELVPDVELPDISTPDIDLPDVNLPDINWQDLFKMFAGGMMSGAATQVVPSPTRTTDDLFGFETEVGLGDIELAQLQRRYLG